jgi:hypothetical protein
MLKNVKPIFRPIPNFEDHIDFLFETDKIFRDLCKDYMLCVCNILQMNSNIEEYENLRNHLDQDILRMIGGTNNPEM